MKIQRPLLATAVPVALAVSCAGPALAAAAPKVSVRVEGAKTTLRSASTVTPPSSGSITKAGAPAGTCPAASAAGALNVATHGDWGGTYSSGLGIEVTDILGTHALYAQGSYWEFFVDNHVASEGVCNTKLKAGEQLLFAQVPAKGAAELPIVLRAPRSVKAGHAFVVRSFVDTGKGSATKPVNVTLTEKGKGKVKGSRSAAGATRLMATRPGTYTLTGSATREIRSAPVTVKVVR